MARCIEWMLDKGRSFDGLAAGLVEGREKKERKQPALFEVNLNIMVIDVKSDQDAEEAV